MVHPRQALVVLVAGLSLGPVSAAAADGPLPLRGRVLGPDGGPRAGAEVRLDCLGPVCPEDAETPTGRTGKAGVYELAAPGAGLWRVVVRHPDHPPAALGPLAVRGPRRLRPLELRPGAVLELRVSDPRGRAVPGADVRVRPPVETSPASEPAWAPAEASACTDLNGAARLVVGEPPFELTVSAPGHPPLVRQIAATGRIEIHLEEGWGRAVRVRGPDGRPVAGVTARLDGVPLPATSDDDGRLVLQAPAGREALLELLAPDRRWARAVLAATAGDAEGDAVLVLAEPVLVRGEVLDAVRGEGLAGALVWTPDERPAVASTGPRGAFLLRLPFDVPPRLEADAAGHVGRRTRLPGAGGPPLRIVLRPGRAAFGRVLDVDARPVAGAEVRWLPAADGNELAGIAPSSAAARTALSDADGRFDLPVSPVGRIDLRASADGFTPATVRGVALPPGDGPVDLGTLFLDPGATVRGRVVDPRSRPVEGAEVVVVPAPGGAVWERTQDARLPTATTAGDGGFALTGLEPGEAIELRVTRPGYVARTVRLAAGPGETAEVVVLLELSGRLAGRVVDLDGEPVAGALVAALDAGRDGGPGAADAPRGAARSDDDGRFELTDLEPGRWRLLVLARGFLDGGLEDLELAPGDELDELEVVLDPGAGLEGTVVDGDRRPVAGATVALLENGRDGAFHMAELPESTSDADGRYRLAGVLPGRRALTARHPGYADARHEVEVGDGTTPFDVVLRRGVEVSGRVVDALGRGVGRVRLDLLPRGETMAPAPVSAAADGSFRFSAVAAGDYRLLAEKAGWATASSEVGVGDADLSGLELRLGQGGRIAGRVLGLTGDQLASVQVVAQAPGLPARPGRLDPGGRYQVAGLEAGEWRVTAHAAALGRQVSVVAVVADGEEAGVDLEFVAGFTLTGLVERAGAPVPGTLVGVQDGAGAQGAAVTDAAGRFVVPGLRAGSYSVTLLHPRSGLSHHETLALEGDLAVAFELPDPSSTKEDLP